MAGRGRAESPTSPRRLNAAEKQRQALELRKAGVSYREIARQLGYRDHAGARVAVQAALDKMLREPAEELRQLEAERLDALLLTLWPLARRGDLGTIDRVLRVMERRAKLLGLDTPQAIDVAQSGEVTIRVVYDDDAHR